MRRSNPTRRACLHSRKQDDVLSHVNEEFPMSTCPSCGRDAGANEICPHCGADLKRRLKIRTFGILAIVVAVAGVALLLFFATRLPVPTVKIGDITSTSNYA